MAHRYLSQYIHTFAYSVRQLSQFRAGDLDSLSLVSVVIDYASAYLAFAIRDYTKLFEDEAPVPEQIAAIIHKWEGIASYVGGEASDA